MHPSKKQSVAWLYTTHARQLRSLRARHCSCDRCILFTSWVGQAWEETAAKKEMVMRAFRKCGVSLPIDGSHDAEINIREFDNYTIDEETYSDDDGEDPFADL